LCQKHLLLAHVDPLPRAVKVALYTRISTDGQITDNQRIGLERVAAARVWQIAQLYDDSGVSGAKGRRSGYSSMRSSKPPGAENSTMVAAWSVDRLGRSLRDLIDFLNELRGLALLSICTSRQSIPPPRRAERSSR
jgi:DNA invertase Pin-like site-specific DNA recombinase